MAIKTVIESSTSFLPHIISELRLQHEWFIGHPSIVYPDSGWKVETLMNEQNGNQIVYVTCDCTTNGVSFTEEINYRWPLEVIKAQFRNNENWVVHIDTQRLGEEPTAKIMRMSLG